MADYKYQVSIGWDKNRGWSMLANVPADSLDELDEGILDMYERIENIHSKLTRLIETDQLNESFKKGANHMDWKACKHCGEKAEYKEGIAKTGRKWKAYFCSSDNKEHTEWVQ